MVLVGIGQLFAGSAERRTLVARCLGSSAAVALHDPEADVAGMLHWMLPESKIDRRRAAANPCLFADTGIPRLLAALVEVGAERKRLRACLAGGASLPEGAGWDVGGRNRESGKRLLAAAGIRVQHEETGGVVVRELSLEAEFGAFLVRAMNV